MLVGLIASCLIGYVLLRIGVSQLEHMGVNQADKQGFGWINFVNAFAQAIPGTFVFLTVFLVCYGRREFRLSIWHFIPFALLVLSVAIASLTFDIAFQNPSSLIRAYLFNWWKLAAFSMSTTVLGLVFRRQIAERLFNVSSSK